MEMADAVARGGVGDEIDLTVLYDDRCPLCRRLEHWMSAQSTLRPVTFLAAASAEARQRYPALDHERTTRVLTVVTSDGAVFEGERAWVVCAWALPVWQPLTEHATGRVRLRLVRLATRAIDGYRHRLMANAPSRECCTVTAPR
jgi:predicted DCC family thiol-disulfide oxidoreductase YuxK